MAKELGARTPLSITVLERGGPRMPDYIDGMDELEYIVRMHMMQDSSTRRVTLRHNANERLAPIRQFGAFLPGTGVGGTGEHWGAVYPRLMPDCFEMYSKTVERYGKQKLPEDHSIQDWGITYDELEPYYARAEREVGISGKAGNLNGKKIEGGNIFEGWRSSGISHAADARCLTSPRCSATRRNRWATIPSPIPRRFPAWSTRIPTASRARPAPFADSANARRA